MRFIYLFTYIFKKVSKLYVIIYCLIKQNIIGILKNVHFKQK